MTTPADTATKRCPGFAGIGQAAHELPADLENFNSNKGSKDGLSSRCRTCGNAYGKAWAARARAIAKADAVDPSLEGGITRDRALDVARQPVENYGPQGVRAYDPVPATPFNLDSAPAIVKDGSYGTPPQTYADQKNVTPPPALEAAKALARPGWTVEAVGGNVYDVPTDTEAVGSPEGQQALEAVNAAIAAERRRKDAERKRNERAAKKQAAATA